MPDLLSFEAFAPGQIHDLGTMSVCREEIIAFAAEFDPQPFHLDEAAGAASLLGGLAASGWHTCSLVMRLLADNLLNHSTCQGSPGVTELRWLHPLFPGDTLSAKAEVLDVRELRSKPTLGLVSFRVTAANQDGRQILLQENPILFLKREAL